MRRWRRVTLITATAILVLVLGLMGAFMWLQSSGRLTRYAQEMVQAHSGQNLSFESVAFASWNVVALTHVRLQQSLPGWQVNITCPRVEARYTLQGLRRKQISAVHLIQPTVHLQARDIPATSDARGETPAVMALPVERIQVRDATLQVNRDRTSFLLNRIQISLRQLAAQQIGLDVRANFDNDIANLRIQGDLFLDLAHPTGTFDMSLHHIDLPRLIAGERLPLPPNWTLTKGALDVAASQVELRGQTLKGTLKIDLEHGHGNIAATTLEDAGLTAYLSFEANLTDHTASLQGPMQVRATKIQQAATGLIATQLTAQLPVQLTYATEQWHAHTDLRLRSEHLELAAAGGLQLWQFSQTASIDAQSTSTGWSLKGDLAFEAPRAAVASMQFQQLKGQTPVTWIAASKQWQSTIDLSLQSQVLGAKNVFQLQKLSSQLPLTFKSTPRRWVIEGTADLRAHRLRIDAAQSAATSSAFEHVQSRLPVRITSTALAARDARLQIKTVRWQPDPDTSITSSLDLRTTADLDLQRLQVDAKRFDLDLPNLGRMKGSGTWQWTTGTTQNLHLTIAPKGLETIWSHIASLLPPPYPTWQIAGQSQVDLHAPRLVWRGGAPTQPLTITWHLRDMSFSNPEGDDAGKNIDGRVEATVSLTPDWRPSSTQGALTLKPFALLVGNFFPELEQYRVTSKITFNST